MGPGHHHRERRESCPGRGVFGQRLGVSAVIVMPQTTPQIKVDAVRSMGAEVELHGDSYAEAKAHCDELVAESGTNVHPSLRRSTRDRGTGDDRRRDSAA